MQYGFSRTLLLTLAGPLIWAGHFLFIYSLHGVVCARAALHGTWVGVPLFTWIILSASLIALASMTLLYLGLRKRLPRIGNPGFLPWLSGTLILLSAVAIIWETIPVLVVPSCG